MDSESSIGIAGLLLGLCLLIWILIAAVAMTLFTSKEEEVYFTATSTKALPVQELEITHKPWRTY